MSTNRKKKILLVDDEPIIALSHAKIIETHGFNVETVQTKQAALRYLETAAGGIDLVLMDLDLGSKTDGIEAAQKILEVNNIPIVFYTFHNEESYIRKTELVPHYGYILKSAGESIVIEAINTALTLFEARKEIEESERKYHTLFDTVADAIVSTDSEQIITNWNAAAEKIYGWKGDEVIGRHLTDILTISYPENNRDEIINRFFRDGYWEGITNQQTKDGKNLIISTRVKLLRDDSGNPKEFVAVNRDITKEQTSQTALIERELQFQVLIETSPDAVIQTDLEGNIIYLNKEASRLSGLKKMEKLIGQNAFELYLEEGKESPVLEEILSEGYIKSREYTIEWEDGTSFTGELSASLVQDKEGKPVSIIGIIHDITERKRLMEDLREKKKQAEEADKLKSTFLSSMSHEIRTPLNAIIGFIDIILDNNKLDPEDKESMGTVKQSSYFLSQLINDILDFSKIEADQLLLEDIVFSLDAVFENMRSIGAMLIRNQKKNLSLRPCVPESIHKLLWGDPLRLGQVLVNLMSNAVKFTEKGFIEYGVREADANTLEFYIRDTGCGIPEEKKEIIFEPFRQAEENTTRRYGGTGLGLSIVKKLIEAMDGSIDYVSRLGEGTTFYFNIPYRKASIPEEIFSEPGPFIVQNKGASILVVEDNKINQQVMRTMLEKSGYTPILADDGRDAISLLKTKPDIGLVFMDLYMPYLDGIEATKVIRRTEQEGEEKNRIPIVALTAASTVEEKNLMLDAGCDDYLAKPILLANLTGIINKYICS